MIRQLSAWFGPRPVLTVALPMYRSRKIAWLALESLARQEGADFPWELIVAEEREEALGESGVRAYEDALRRAGCVRLHYIKLKRWLPLAMKWRMIGRETSASSKIFALQAADCYSPPRRITETHKLMSDADIDWCQTSQGAAYHVRLRKTLRFDAEMEGWDYPTAYFMAMRTRSARALPAAEIERGVDRWLFESSAAQKGAPLRVAMGRDWWRGGMETKGLNAISLLDRRFLRPMAPFREDDENLLGELPEDIHEQLAALAETDIPHDRERARRMNINLRRRGRRLAAKGD